MTGSSTARSRAKNSLPQINVAAKEYVSSNSTSAMFVGGQQKSWMTGPRDVQVNVHRTPSKMDLGRKPGTVRERPVDQSSGSSTTGNLGLNSTTSLPYQPPGNAQSSPADHCLDRNGQYGIALRKDSGVAIHSVETVLPSPAPSDEHHFDNIHAQDSEIDGQVTNVHEGLIHSPSNIHSMATASANDPEENDFDRMLRNTTSAATPPASDVAIDQARQPSRHSTGNTAVRQTPHQGPSEMKRKRDDTGFGAGGLGARPRHTPPSIESAKRQAPTDVEVGRLQRILIDRQQQRATISAPGDAEVARLNLLHRACMQHDYVYLLLHQIYCMDPSLPSVAIQLGELGFRPEHNNGLAMLNPLLLPNLPCLAGDSVRWFAHFPSPIRSLLEDYQKYRQALESVKLCLAALSRGWLSYRDHCNKRSYPALVGELTEILSIESPVLQSVVFRAILKDMWMGNTNDSCFQEAEGLFHQNQRLLQQSRSPADRQRDDQHLIIMYQQLHATHATHAVHRRNSGLNASPSNMVNSRPLMTDPPTQQSTPLHQPSRPPHGPPARPQHNSRARPLLDLRRAPPSPSVSTQFAYHPTTLASGTTPTLPSQAGLPSQSSRSASPGNASGYLMSPPTPASSAGPQASQIRWPNNSGPSPVASPVPFPFPQTFVGQNPPQASWAGSRPAPSTTLPRSHQVPHTQGSRPAPLNPSPLNRALEMPHSSPSPRIMHSQPLVPPVGQRLSTTARPNPIVVALHQSQARSPILTVVDDSGQPTANTKYFRYIEGVAILGSRLKIGKRQHAEFCFFIGEDDAALLSGTREGQKGGPFVRNVMLSSRFGRVRCIDATKITDLQHDNQRSWVTANQAWPEHVTVIFNGKHLDVRKKLHYGKDLPIDVTAAIQLGNNQFSVSILSPKAEDQTEYAIGLETIQLVDAAGAKALTGVLPYDQARQRVLRRIQNEDPDIEVVNTHVVINMSDPYTSRIWNVPMRGRYCLHDQCFDFDTFLETRTSKRAGQPCDPDQFKCPVCGGDARPQSLVKDEFFEALRAELARRGRLDAKAIVMQQDGTWEVQEEEKTGETGDGSGRRLGPKAGTMAHATTKDGNSTAGQMQVIEID
ncbi:MAG: hypothetical protein Q9168_000430 [Polycauliona sp. 1 TL-2023]